MIWTNNNVFVLSDIYKLIDDEVEKLVIVKTSGRDDSGRTELRAHLYRLQKFMLALIPKFQSPYTMNLEKQNLMFVRIIANVMLYVRNQMQRTCMDQKLRNIIFEPFFSPETNSYDIETRETSPGMHLGIVVDCLVSTTNLLHQELTQKKLICLKGMSSSEHKQVNLARKLTHSLIPTKALHKL